MWKFKKGEVIRVKLTGYWGHVVGFTTGDMKSARVIVELETGSRCACWPEELETEVDL